jgi:RNA polymerase sigma factor (TIGR02999 family)
MKLFFSAAWLWLLAQRIIWFPPDSLAGSTMNPVPPAEITQLLVRSSQGDKAALDQLLPLVYQELRRLAHHQLQKERGNHSLQATALVHEAYLRLADQKEVDWENRYHFFAIAAQTMRRVLVDYARARQSDKRGGGAVQVSLTHAEDKAAAEVAEIISLDEALSRLAALAPRQSQIIELRYFGGLSVDETAAVLQVSPSTVHSDWRQARAWLYLQLSEG